MKTFYFSILLTLVVLTPSDFVKAGYFTLPTSELQVNSWFDHTSPEYFPNDDSSTFTRYDGNTWPDSQASLSTCTLGLNCYNGHDGIDFDGDTGDDILAAAAGTVGDAYWNSCTGYTMRLWHPSYSLSTFYYHLDSFVAAEEQEVSRSEHIAEMGGTGSCTTGSHLHFGVGTADSTGGDRVDPYGWSGAGSDPWGPNQGYLWTTNPPSLDVYTSVSGTINSNTTWYSNVVYVIESATTLAASASLHVQPGAIVKLKQYATLTINGELAVNGTVAFPSYFTSWNDDTIGGNTNGGSSSEYSSAGYWGQIEFANGSSSSLNHAVVRYGGNSYYNLFVSGGNLNVDNSVIASAAYTAYSQGGGTATINNSTFKDNTYGVAPYAGTLTMDGNTFTDNSTAPAYLNMSSNMDFIPSNTMVTGTGKRGFVFSGTIEADTTLYPDIPYIIDPSTSIIVPTNKVLTINPGTIVKLATNSYFTVTGRMDVNGTASSPSYFTSYKDDTIGGDTNNDGSSWGTLSHWDAIYMNTGSKASISYGVFKYGGRTGGAELFMYAGDLELSRSTVASTSNWGIYVGGGTASVSHTVITDTTTGIGTAVTNLNLQNQYNSFFSNSSYGLYNGSGSSINAENNWWGVDTGPNTTGADSTSGTVDADPWLTSAP